MLTASFHRFAGVAPASWQTYARLAALAQEKHGLHVPAPALPERTLNQGGPPPPNTQHQLILITCCQFERLRFFLEENYATPFKRAGLSGLLFKAGHLQASFSKC